MPTLKRIFFPKKASAETEVCIPMFFDAPIPDTDKTILRCHLYDEVFNIDYYLPDIRLGTLEAPQKEPHNIWLNTLFDDELYLPHTRIAKLLFPEELAGGTFSIEFLIQSFPENIDPVKTAYTAAKEQTSQIHDKAMKKYFMERIQEDIDRLLNRLAEPSTNKPQCIPFQFHHVNNNYFRSNIEVTSKDPKAPMIESVCWGIDEKIKFGKPSAPRTDKRVGKNETLFLHIQTRGLYGQEVPTSIGTVRVKDNTSVNVGQLWYWVSRSETFFFDSSTNQIKGYAGLYYSNTDGSLDTTKFNQKSIIQASPQLIYDAARITPIAPSNTAVAASVGGQAKQEMLSDARCMVEFRPSSAYQGDFGFSWYRKGDMQLHGTRSYTNSRLNHTVTTINDPCNDQDFGEIMGHHYETVIIGGKQIDYIVQNGNDSSTHALFKKDPVMFSNHGMDYYRILMRGMDNQKYHIPYMTICKGIEAELSLHISVKEQPEKLMYRFDNPKVLSEGYMTIAGAATAHEDSSPPGITTGNPDIGKTIKIKCLKEFSKPVKLEVYAKVKGDDAEYLCGAVRILPNDVLHQRKIKVVFFNVITNLAGGKAKLGITQNNTTEKDALRKYLGQAYVIPDIEIEDLKLINTTTGLTDLGYLACCIDTDGDGIKDMVDSYQFDLKGFLVKKVRSLGLEDKYKNHFKIFFIGDRDYTRNGFSSGEKFTVCFATAKKETPTHELGHALGLPHTFDGSTSRAKYVYEDGMTDNIMDYSHQIGVNRQSLFHWQWQSVNIKIES